MTMNEKYYEIKINALPPEEFKSHLDKEKENFLIDVRPMGFKPLTWFIKGYEYQHWPLLTLSQEYKKIPEGRKIFIIDGYFKQAPMAAKFLILQGYEVAGVLKGGTARWIEEGLPGVDMREEMERQAGDFSGEE